MPIYPTLSSAANNVVGWFATLRLKGFDQTAQPLKLQKEAIEFAAAPSLDEAADVFISLLGAVAGQGWSVGQLSKAVHEKMIVNRGRTWKQLEDGTYQHV